MCMPMKLQSFSLKQLEEIHHEITSFKSITKPDSKQLKNISQKLKAYVEMVVWGDKHNSDFVDFFCETKSLETMIEIFAAIKIESVLISIIEGISKLLINLSREESLHYFLSNSALMKFQMIKFATIDPELSQYYINFLKSVSIRLNFITIKLFYNQKYSNFPLIWQAIKFYNHPETLIRNTSNTIILSVAKIEDPKVHRYFSSFPFIIYYSHLAYFTYDICLKIDKGLNMQEPPFVKLNQHYDELSNLMIYFEDLLGTVKGCTNTILNAYIQGVIVYMNYALFSDFRTFFSPKMAMFFFSLLMRESGCEKLVNFVVLMLMGKYLKKSFGSKLEEIEAIHRLKSHSKKWNFHGFWDDFIPELSQYTRGIFNEEPQEFNDLAQSINPLANTFYFRSPPQTPKTDKTFQFTKEPDLLSQYTTIQSQKQQELLETESQPQYTECQYQRRPLTPYQKQISKLERIHTVQIDPDTPPQMTPSILTITQRVQQELQDTLIDLEEMDDNHTRSTILGFLRSTDEELIILTIDFLGHTLRNKAVSKDILSFAGLDLTKTLDYDNLETIGQIMRSCFEILRTPHRLQTYKKAIQLIDRLCQKQHILEIHKEGLMSVCKEYIKQVYMFLSSSKSVIKKIESYEYARKESMKSIIGVGFLELISSGSRLSEEQKSIAVYFNLRNLRVKIFKQNHKSLNLSKIIVAKPGYQLNQQMTIPPTISPCEMFESHSQKGKKCYLLIENNHMILIEKSSSKIIFLMDVIRTSGTRDTTNPKRNEVKIKESDTKWVTLRLQFGDQKTAEKEHLALEKMKVKRGEEILNTIVNQLIEYESSIDANQ